MIRRTLTTAAAGLGAVIGLTTSLVTAAPAQAVPNAGHYQEVWSYFSGAPNSYVAGNVYCPAGQRVVNGGAGNGLLLDLQPLANGSGYYAAGRVSPSGPNYLSVQAVCAPSSDFTGSTRRSVLVRDHRGLNRAGYTVSCPAGTTAFAGGLSFVPKSGTNNLPSHYGVYADFPRSRGLNWTLGSWGDTSKYDLSTSVECQPNRGGFKTVVVQRTYTPTAGPLGSFAGGYATCPAGTKPYAGGAWWSRPGESISTSGRLSASYSTHLPDGWWASGQAYASDATLHVIARCSQPVA